MTETFEPSKALDVYERRILKALQEDGRLSVQQIAEQIGLSSSPTWRRIRSLEERGVIRRYVALLDPRRAGVAQCVFAHVTLVRHDAAAIASFEQSIAARPEVLECFAISGDSDYILRVAVPDTTAFELFLREALFGCAVVQQVRSAFALRTVKFETALPV
jgi:Lrp/AsnC family leucine-responsive transcriptional regulator